MLTLLEDLKLVSPEFNITVLTDADVDNASIFKNNNNNMAVVAMHKLLAVVLAITRMML